MSAWGHCKANFLITNRLDHCDAVVWSSLCKLPPYFIMRLACMAFPFVCLQETQESLFATRAKADLSKKGGEGRCPLAQGRRVKTGANTIMVHVGIEQGAKSGSSHFRTTDEVLDWNCSVQH